MTTAFYNSIGRKYKTKKHLFKPLMWFIIIAFLFYLGILLAFAFWFQQTGELCYTNKPFAITSFEDCFYFSCITFHTIGYGDIIPDGETSKRLVILLSFISLLFVVLFSGYSIHLFIKVGDEQKKLKVKYIALQNLLKITDAFSGKFILPKFIDSVNDVSIDICYGQYYVFVRKIKDATQLSDIIDELEKDLKLHVEGLKYTDSDIRHILSVKRIEDYLNCIECYLKNLKEHNQKYGEYTDEVISTKIYDIIQEIEQFNDLKELNPKESISRDLLSKELILNLLKNNFIENDKMTESFLSSELEDTCFVESNDIVHPISMLVTKAIELQKELLSMGKQQNNTV